VRELGRRNNEEVRLGLLPTATADVRIWVGRREARRGSRRQGRQDLRGKRRGEGDGEGAGGRMRLRGVQRQQNRV
jgi:hypothetical protein